MTIERAVTLAYLAGCIGVGLLASRRVLNSCDEYWVAGRRIGTFVNSLAIMAAPRCLPSRRSAACGFRI